MIGLDKLNYRLGSVNIGLDQLISVWIGYYQSRLVNVGLDGLNIKKYWLILVMIGQYRLKCWLRLTDINRYLYRIILTNYRLILTSYRLKMPKTEYIVV